MSIWFGAWNGWGTSIISGAVAGGTAVGILLKSRQIDRNDKRMDQGWAYAMELSDWSRETLDLLSLRSPRTSVGRSAVVVSGSPAGAELEKVTPAFDRLLTRLRGSLGFKNEEFVTVVGQLANNIWVGAILLADRPRPLTSEEQGLVAQLRSVEARTATAVNGWFSGPKGEKAGRVIELQGLKQELWTACNLVLENSPFPREPSST